MSDVVSRLSPHATWTSSEPRESSRSSKNESATPESTSVLILTYSTLLLRLPGGWSTRELLTILDGLEGLSIVGADVVEVAPAYDNNGETTVLAAAEIAYSLIDLMVLKSVQ
ncbi:uncharacterized protein N0V96_000107 [Colletotrichum fioriniae]|uniref:uncharacterized protein n=1 Tax=Colletotrichum fioriniae TaxID=710243 RepID=UPI0032DB6C08|nr:hypothetical protein N0V96_000107 [Colletotrichum fioriniae]